MIELNTSTRDKVTGSTSVCGHKHARDIILTWYSVDVFQFAQFRVAEFLVVLSAKSVAQNGIVAIAPGIRAKSSKRE